MLTHPNGARALCALVTRSNVRGLLLTNIPYAQLLVSGGGHQEVTASVPGKGLHDIVVLQLQWCLSGANIPELDGKVARGGGENVLGRGVKKDLADLSTQLSDSFAQKCAVWSLVLEDLYGLPYLECPASLLTGATSAGSSASVKREKSLGTSHIKILPSSEPDAMMRSLNGCLETKIKS